MEKTGLCVNCRLHSWTQSKFTIIHHLVYPMINGGLGIFVGGKGEKVVLAVNT